MQQLLLKNKQTVFTHKYHIVTEDNAFFQCLEYADIFNSNHSKMFQTIRLKCHFGILIHNLKISCKALIEDLEHNPAFATCERSLGVQFHNPC